MCLLIGNFSSPTKFTTNSRTKTHVSIFNWSRGSSQRQIRQSVRLEGDLRFPETETRFASIGVVILVFERHL